jgi:3',5'-cyclic AMP phosphodiesterase CpdA
MPQSPKVVGPAGQLYADPEPSPDETTFREDNSSAQYYQSPYYLAHKTQVQPIPPRHALTPLQLNQFLPLTMITAIQQSGKIQFHVAGDTGAAKVGRSQTAATALGHEAHVADSMARDVQNGGNTGPAFLFLVGDVIYNFGEAQYYYDQFYEPFRAYDRPIFAIPGNHDGMVFGPSSTAPQTPTLAAFLTNFCARTAGRSPDALGMMRSAMTQPGVYFTLDAPFVSIIGLYSNVLEGPGVISSQGGHYPISDEQLTFLKAELARLKPDRDAGNRAVVIAVHHPPLSIDAVHGGSTGVQADLDACSAAANLWPDLVVSGHAHLYQRFTHRTTTGKEIPYIVAGDGGYAVTTPRSNSPRAGTTVGPDTLVVPPIVEFGYLTVTASGTQLSVVFTTATGAGVQVRDSVTVDLQKNGISGQGQGAKSPKSAPRSASSRAAPRARTTPGRRKTKGAAKRSRSARKKSPSR